MSKNVQSIQMKLKHLSRTTNSVHQLTITRYFQERLLYRLSISRYKQNFFLKGGALIFALEKEASRPTLDLDLLAKQVKSDVGEILEIFQNICSITYPEDGVSFNVEKIETVEMIKEGRYSGVRVKIPASLGNIKQRMQVDIGFGDNIFPGPVEMEYPTLLNLNPPVVNAYTVESLVSEKFEAMIDLSEMNSRMKDFYDIYKILNAGNFNADNIKNAIHSTIQRRGTNLLDNHPVFGKEFATDALRNIQWEAFLKKARLDQSISFQDLMALIKKQLEPVYEDIKLKLKDQKK